MSQLSRIIKPFSFILSVLAISLSLSYIVLAWAEPTANPPANNVSAPVNVSATSQTKTGNLKVAEMQATTFKDASNISYFVDPNGDGSGNAAILNGRVGIGTTVPTGHKLDIASNQGGAGNSAIRALYPGGGGLLGTEFGALAHRAGVWTALYAKQGAATSAAYFDGNVGIGMSTPAAKLDVNGNIHAAADICTDAGGGKCLSTAGGGLPVGVSGQTLRHNGTNWVADSLLYNNGTNIGIGTATPESTSILHLAKLGGAGSGWTEQRIQSTDPAGGSDIHLVNSNNDTFSLAFGGPANASGAKFSIEQFNGVNWDGRVVIDPANGNVGIGEWAPAAQLDIANKSSDSMLRFQRCVGGVCGGTAYYRFDMGTDGTFVLRDEDEVDRLAVKGGVGYNNGYVGIGTADPLDKLTVAGDSTGADDSSIAIINNYSTDAKTRLRFITDAGEFLMGRTSTTYNPYPASAGDAFFNLTGPGGVPATTKNIRFMSNAGDRMLITPTGDVLIPTSGQGLILRSSGGNCFRLTVSDGGALSTASVVCPGI